VAAFLLFQLLSAEKWAARAKVFASSMFHSALPRPLAPRTDGPRKVSTLMPKSEMPKSESTLERIKILIYPANLCVRSFPLPVSQNGIRT
jgi:hypothetical protein